MFRFRSPLTLSWLSAKSKLNYEKKQKIDGSKLVSDFPVAADKLRTSRYRQRQAREDRELA